MAPRRVVVAPPTRRAPPRGVLGGTWATLTDPENASTVRAIATFGAAVAFLSSSWSELLLPT
ncbi:hypothetical protein AAP_04591 [Ascosphaera apis ARSEF 7405]|uniref:TOM core complex subunit Tom6 n=1 Tax=Ascosphaera apis ARSEF 7405 TaxID=392613 RepID=A0A167WP65_9EURO|nr:hypothetical protein AAP_04591 [Ascosphaera apis ARSEF 7405]